jgi:LuxR family maltose regulon positive regulatory protein
MFDALLATKVSIPEPTRAIVARPRLTGALEDGLKRYRLTVVSAPAGYGKSTLLADWAHTTTTPVGWLTLGVDDNDPARFLRGLLASWERIWPELAGSPLGLLLGSQEADPQTVLAAFINAAALIETDQVLVLDDYHLIQETAVHEHLAFLLDHLPPRLHIALGTRAEPPLPLARYRARGQLLELDAHDLRFTFDEAADFLKALQVKVSNDILARLQGGLEGWAAGLQLAALSLRHRDRLALEESLISGRQRFVADYLSQEVFDGLSAEMRTFLVQTSLLERLSGPLCEAVTGTTGGQAMLEQLERQNLFVEALDDERRWFRCHPIWADFLRAELARQPSEQVAALHRRAAAWFAEQELPEPAYTHALAGRDRERVIALAEKYLMAKLWRGEFRIVRRWTEAVPAEWAATYPLFGLIRAGALAFSGALEAAAHSIDETEANLRAAPGPVEPWHMARIKAIRCGLACMQNDLATAERYADQAQHELQTDDVYFRAITNGSLGDAYRLNGRWAEAQARYLGALESARNSRFPFMTIPSLGALADLALRQGRLRQAAEYWREALAALELPNTASYVPLPLAGWLHIRLGEIQYEWGERDTAERNLAQGLERAELGGDVRAILAGLVTTARLALTAGESEGAQRCLERAEALLKEAQFPDWAARFERVRLEFWLAQDLLRTAVDWSDERRARGFAGQPETEAAQLAVARVLLFKGDAPARDVALALLEDTLAAAEREGRTGVAIEALALQALARQARGDELAAALVLLERALHLAEPEGYLRLFADLGLPMGRLLQSARARGVRPEYVDRLLAAFGQPELTKPGAAALPEPLTERELDVLRLLAAGLTNREIAEHLVVSAETVKKHCGNIYGKLSARNRTQAVARARALHLLD